MKAITYSDAGVNIGAADQTTTGFKDDVKATYTKNVIRGIGAFGGMFRLPKGYKNPILVSSMDGVGTKLKVALMAGAHRTVGLDLVHHCINDIAVQGAKPLYLFDYYGTGKLDPSVATEVIKGIARACKYNGLALLGGETAEMPGFYTGNTYDLVAHITGIVEHSKIPNPKRIKSGHVLVGLPSSGLHTNGYSLARKLLFEVAGYKIDSHVEEFGCTVGKELLKFHQCYLRPIQSLMKHDLLDGAAHITGGGIIDNVPRILPKHLAAFIDPRAWQIPAVFQVLRKIGNTPLDDFRRTFNLGIGMVLAVSEENQPKAIKILKRMGEDPVVLGKVAKRGGPNKPQLVYME